MKRTLVAVLALTLMGSAGTPAPLMAQPRGDWRWNGDRNSNWDPSFHYRAPPRGHRSRRMTRNDRIYRGRDGRFYCRRNDGTTGLVVGGISGALLGGAIGGDSLSALIGGIGGAALGSAVDRGQVTCR